MSWTSAKTACTSLNRASSLAIINSAEENDFLTQCAIDLVEYGELDYKTSYYIGIKI